MPHAAGGAACTWVGEHITWLQGMAALQRMTGQHCSNQAPASLTLGQLA
jgi:hypothetical protein